MITPSSPNANRVHCFRLTPAQDLKIELVRFCKENKIKAACLLSVVGSLQKINLRLANSSQTITSEQKYEIVSATGTLSENGCHIHLSAADSTAQVIGGHLLDENIIFTTCELIILELVDFEFKRELDPMTTFNELKIYLTKS